MRRSIFGLLLLLSAVPALAKPPVWDRRIDSPQRFKVLKAFDSEAVLDQETGVVWAREAGTGSGWSNAFAECASRTIGGRGGWRLPTVHEFRSLVPATAQALPEGHPFAVPDGYFWTSTTNPANPTDAYVGDLGNTGANINLSDKGVSHGAWCVRGGVGASVDGF
jgi:hypothetical protein